MSRAPNTISGVQISQFPNVFFRHIRASYFTVLMSVNVVELK